MGVPSCRRVVAGRGANLFGGVGSFPGEGVVFAALQFLLEQELEVFLSLSCGFVLLGGDPKVELLCILVQRSQRLVGRCWVPLGGRLSALWDRVDGGGREGGRRRRRRGRRRRVSERVGAGGRRDGHGCWRIGMISVLLALGRRWNFAVKKSRCRGRLTSEKLEGRSAVSHSTRSQLQRRCVFLGGYSVFNGH